MGEPPVNSPIKSPAATAAWPRAVLGWGIALVLFLTFFEPLSLILLGVLATAAIAAMLAPLVNRVRWSRKLAALAVCGGFLLIVGGTLALLVWALVDPIRDQVRQWPELREAINDYLARWSGRLGLDYSITVENLTDQLLKLLFGGQAGRIVSQATNVTATVFIVTAFIFIGSLFMLTARPAALVRPIIHLLPPRYHEKIRGVFKDLGPLLRAWLLGTLASMAIVGGASYVGYRIIGLRFALPLAVFAGLSEAVPTVGPAITLVLSLLIASTQSPGLMVGAAVVYLVIQALESYVIVPLIMKHAVNVPPVVTLFTIVLWGKIYGMAGLLLAIPIDLVIWSVLTHFVIRPHRQELHRLIAGDNR